MTFDLLRFAWSSSLWLCLAWCAVGLLRRASADLRDRIWRAALAGTVLLAVPLPVPEGMRITVTALGGPMAAPTEPAAPWLWAVLWAVWAAGAGLLLARLLGGLARLVFLTRSAGASAQPNIRVGGVSTPLTWGIVQPVILLPEYALEWSEEQRRQAIRHEQAHIERRDWLWQVFAQLATAAFWFHPLVWLAAAGMRREADRAADDAVLTTGAEARGYAAQLVEVAKRLRGTAPQAGVAMVRRKALESRIAAILDETQRRTPSSTRAKAVVPLAAAGLLVILAACQSARVYRVQQVTTPPKPVSIHEPQYSDEARQDQLQGTVVLAVVVDQQGLAQNIHVTRSLGEGLDEKATEAIKQWRFEPGRLKGKPVRVAATIEVNFKLK